MSQIFTIEQANKALLFVRPVVEEIKLLWDEMVEEDKQFANLERLENVASELKLVGCDLRDINTGMLDFPTLYKGELVQLSWKLGEEQITHWHFNESDFRKRNPIDDEFRLFNSGANIPVQST